MLQTPKANTAQINNNHDSKHVIFLINFLLKLSARSVELLLMLYQKCKKCYNFLNITLF